MVSLRLPRAKEELAMCLHSGAAALAPGGSLLVYGAKDEGIQAAPRAMSEIFGTVETVAVGGHCRVLLGMFRSGEVRIRGALEDWKTRGRLDHPDVPTGWVSYPGVFAHGRLDHGTRVLLGALPPLAAGARVLDFGCGSGVVGYVAEARGEGVRLELLDVDAVALEASKENVPGARLHLRDGLPPTGAGTFDAILSNPPFHRGKGEDRGLLFSLIGQAPRLLGRGGRLVFVTQKRLRVEDALRRAFLDVTTLGEDSVFRVWMGEGPRIPQEA
jgi:16S rRNA (guanine1207-N2)-methyltransferase